MSSSRRYAFGFVLSTGAGNETRTLTLRKYAERDPQVSCTWAQNPGVPEREFAPLPRALAKRLSVLKLAAPVLAAWPRLDAVMFHAFEPYLLGSALRWAPGSPRIVWSQDDPPTRDPEFWRGYGLEGRSPARTRLRWTLDVACARRADLLLPFSAWAARVLTGECGVRPERVHPLPVGIDLEAWPYVPLAPPARERPKILFVGTMFRRKGGELLLRVFAERFSRDAELHLVAKRTFSEPLPDNVFVHRGLRPNDGTLRRLYAEASLFVLPTLADLSPNVLLEAMATGRPTIASNLHGIPEMVKDGETGFLVPPGDEAALGDRIARLLSSPERATQMGNAGRVHVERHFSAATNVPRILSLMKATVDAR